MSKLKANVNKFKEAGKENWLIYNNKEDIWFCTCREYRMILEEFDWDLHSQVACTHIRKQCEIFKTYKARKSKSYQPQ